MTDCSRVRDPSLPASAVALASPIGFKYIGSVLQTESNQVYSIEVGGEYEFVDIQDNMISLYTSQINLNGWMTGFIPLLKRFTVALSLPMAGRNGTISKTIRLMTVVVLNKESNKTQKIDEDSLEIIPGLKKGIMEVPALAEMMKKRMAAHEHQETETSSASNSFSAKCATPEIIDRALAVCLFRRPDNDRVIVPSDEEGYIATVTWVEREFFPEKEYEYVPSHGGISKAIFDNLQRFKALRIRCMDVDERSFFGVFGLKFPAEGKEAKS
ncbi:MAG: hypothetical protein H0X51_07150 [Parachlamydiaceae bacterium]|nr:hypothetical protein [Parachlamydiaceae bacterium]